VLALCLALLLPPSLSQNIIEHNTTVLDGELYGMGPFVGQIVRTTECLRSGPPDGFKRQVITLELPKTGSRHFHAIMQNEFGTPDTWAKHNMCAMISVHPLPSSLVILRPMSARLQSSAGHHSDANHVSEPHQARRIEACKERAIIHMAHLQKRFELMIEEAAKRKVPILTVVRHPVEFILSNFYYHRPEALKDTNFTQLRRFVSHIPITANMQLGNQVGKGYARLVGIDRASEEHQRSDTYVTSTELIDCVVHNSRPPTLSDLASVLQRVHDGTLLAGITEDFEGTIRMFDDRLKFERFDVNSWETYGPRPSNYDDEKVLAHEKTYGDMSKIRMRRDQVPKDIIDEIMRVNYLDMQLHVALSENVRVANLAHRHKGLAHAPSEL